MQKGQVKLKKVAKRTRKEETAIGTENRKKEESNITEVEWEKESEVEKRQPAVTTRSNRNPLMKFTLVTIKLDGSLVY